MIEQCLILSGGCGSRLKKITQKIPKPLIKYDNKEFLYYLLCNLENQGIKDVLILTHYKSEMFKKFLKKIKKKFTKMKITLIKEKKKLGTGGAVINSFSKQKNYFFLINGDTFFDINLRDFEKKFKKKKDLISIASVDIVNNNSKIANSYKVKKNKILKIYKTKKKRIKKSGGIYIVNKKIIKDYIKHPSIFCDFDQDIIVNNVNTGKIKSITYKKNFLDIGENISIFKKSKKILNKILNKPCCFLDRDGVINYDTGYTHRIKDFMFKPKVKQAIKYLNDKRYYVAIVTNQSGIAKGYYNIKDLENLHKYMLNEIHKFGGYVDRVYYSPFHPNGKVKKYKKKSSYRKPGIGMLKQCDRELQINKSKSFLIGDSLTDIKAAKNFKIKGYLVKANLLDQIKSTTKKN